MCLLITKMSDINEVKSPDQDGYVLHVENFDGPLDLLWDLIKKSKLDITEISLSMVTEQYLEYLRLMESLNLKVAIEFIRMASELIYYKTRALLPADEIEDEYFVPPLPPELVQKLLEYKKYQQASLKLKEHLDFHSDTFVRCAAIEDFIEQEDYIEASLFDLLRAFADVIESQAVVEQEKIVFDEILVSDRIAGITEMLREKDVIDFRDIFTAKPARPEIVASFLAILEMSKTGLITILQHKVFGTIRLARRFAVNEVS